MKQRARKSLEMKTFYFTKKKNTKIKYFLVVIPNPVKHGFSDTAFSDKFHIFLKFLFWF